jgi:16S rRNA (guanine(527)-N(7))-methyltransferase RsmG
LASRELPPDAIGRLRGGAKAILGRELSVEEVERVCEYVDELLTWQDAIRLVGRADPSWIIEELVLDSLLFVRVIPHTARRVVDLGSGAGIPGIPLKIIRPGLALWLVEVRRKRASFLSSVVRRMGWLDVEVVGMRAEEALRSGLMPPRSFDAVVARCAGQASEIAEVGTPFVRDGGVVVIAAPSSKRGAPPGAVWTPVGGARCGEARGFWVIPVSDPTGESGERARTGSQKS